MFLWMYILNYRPICIDLYFLYHKLLKILHFLFKKYSILYIWCIFKYILLKRWAIFHGEIECMAFHVGKYFSLLMSIEFWVLKIILMLSRQCINRHNQSKWIMNYLGKSNVQLQFIVVQSSVQPPVCVWPV